MKTILTIFLAAFAVFSVGCATTAPGNVKMDGPKLTVSLGEKIMERPEKVSMITRHQGVERLHGYLTEKLAAGKIRDSLTFDVSISEFRVGWGPSFMAANVAINEDGKELKRFKSVESTTRGHPVERLTKGLAGRIFKSINDI